MDINNSYFAGITIVKSKNGYVVFNVVFNPKDCWSFETIEHALDFIKSEIDK